MQNLMIFTRFQGVTVMPLGGNECMLSVEQNGNIKALGSIEGAIYQGV